MPLPPENSLLVVYFPGNNRALVYRLKCRWNSIYTRLDYGPLPIPKGATLPTLTGGTATVPADGVLPALAVAGPLTFPAPTGYSAYDPTDMWYLPADYKDRIFYIEARFKPAWLRIELQMPPLVRQVRFQRDRVVLGAEKLWGFARGRVTTVAIPEVRQAFIVANDSNLNVYTKVTFEYGEYIVEIPRDPQVIYEAVVLKRGVHWVTLPVTLVDTNVVNALKKVYGIEGFPVYPPYKRSEALREYAELIKQLVA